MIRIKKVNIRIETDSLSGQVALPKQLQRPVPSTLKRTVFLLVKISRVEDLNRFLRVEPHVNFHALGTRGPARGPRSAFSVEPMDVD